MCKKLILTLLLFLPLWISAQEEQPEVQTLSEAASDTTASEGKSLSKFGYLSYSEVMKLMPEYLSSQEKLDKLQTKYDEELQRADRKFNQLFAEFLDGQKDFPESILIKRQKELQDQMEKSLRFKSEMRTLLEQARKELIVPVKAKLDEAIGKVGQENNLDYILNTDNDACPYINPDRGVDVTGLVKAKLNIE